MPATEAMLTIAPPLSFCQACQVCWAKPSAETTLVSKTLRATFEVEVGDRAEHRVRTGVVDQVVDAAEGLHGALDGDGLVGLVVGLARDADDAVGAECLDGLLEGVLVAAGDAHAVTAGDQRLGDAVADAAARAGDERDLAGEFGSSVVMSVSPGLS